MIEQVMMVRKGISRPRDEVTGRLAAIVFTVVNIALAFTFYFKVLELLPYDEDTDDWFEYAAWFVQLYNGTLLPENFIGNVHYFSHGFTPLVPFLLSIVDFGFNNFYVTSKVVNVAALVLNACMIYDLGKHMGGKTAGYYAVIIFSSFPIVIMMTIDPTTAVTYTVLTACFHSTIIFLRFDYSLKRAMACGVCATLLIFSREIVWPYFVFLPIMVILMLFCDRGLICTNRTSKMIFTALFQYMLPFACYGVFLAVTFSHESIEARFWILNHGWEWSRTPVQFVENGLLALTVSPFLLVMCMKRMNAMTFSLVIWIGMVVASRVLIQAPFWSHYWIGCLVPMALTFSRNAGTVTRIALIAVNLAVGIFVTVYPNIVFYIYLQVWI